MSAALWRAVVDRFESTWAILILDDLGDLDRFPDAATDGSLAVPARLLPAGCHEGDCLIIKADREDIIAAMAGPSAGQWQQRGLADRVHLERDPQFTERRRQMVAAKLDRLRNRPKPSADS